MAGGQDEAVFNSKNLPIAKFNLCVSSVCHLALENASALENAIERKASGFLAKLKINDSWKTVVVMNNHFVSRKEEAHLVLATFHFDGKNELKIVKLDPDIFFRTNKELDYTFVGISQQKENDLLSKHGVIPVKLVQTMLTVNVGDVIHIPQHPDGRQKRLSYSTVCSITKSEVYYKADTSFGSSGSPVLCSENNDMYVLALHKSGGVTLPDGRLANRGILISAILNHMSQHTDNEESPPNVDERASSNGNQESGNFVQGATTNQGLPVVQSQSAENVSSTNPDMPSSSNNQATSEPSYLIQETENPFAKTSDSKSTEPLTTYPEPSPQMRGRPPNCITRPPVCTDQFGTRECIRIAKRIAKVWPIVAKETELFKSYEIDNITCDHTFPNPVMKADRMLTDFKCRLGKREVLAEAIDNAGEPDVAAKVRSGFYINNA